MCLFQYKSAANLSTCIFHVYTGMWWPSPASQPFLLNSWLLEEHVRSNRPPFITYIA